MMTMVGLPPNADIYMLEPLSGRMTMATRMCPEAERN